MDWSRRMDTFIAALMLTMLLAAPHVLAVGKGAEKAHDARSKATAEQTDTTKLAGVR